MNASRDMATRYVNCYARRYDDRWQAVCLDFDLMVEGSSFEEVKEAINAAVISYIEDALEEEREDARRLLNRRAPLFTRIAWTWPFIMSALFGRRKDGNDSSIGFAITCHA